MSEKVVRGVFDSPEEEYARKNGLRFVHDKILVARTRSETPGGYEGRIYYLCFKEGNLYTGYFGRKLHGRRV